MLRKSNQSIVHLVFDNVKVNISLIKKTFVKLIETQEDWVTHISTGDSGSTVLQYSTFALFFMFICFVKLFNLSPGLMVVSVTKVVDIWA